MNQDETIALWNKCQAAKKELLDKGKDENEAHKAAVAVWNAWALGMMEEREKLEEAGAWRSKKSFFVELEENTKTQDWLWRATVDFDNVAFIITGQPLMNLLRDDKTMPEPTKEILCEGESINFSRFLMPGDSDFCYTRFSGVSIFNSTTFFSDAIFDYAEFEKTAHFGMVTFTQKADFSSIISKRSFSLADAHFSFVPDFTEADFHQSPRLDNIHIDRAGGWWQEDRVNENVSAMYRALKRLAGDGKDHNNGMKFFAGEMRTARFNTEFPWHGGGRDRYEEVNRERKQAWEKEEKARKQRGNTKPLPPFVERTVPLWPNVTRFWFSMAYEFFSDFGRSL